MKRACIVILASLAVCHTAMAIDPCPPVHTWSGEVSGDWHGLTIEDVGDINGDGWPELCIGKPAYGGDSTGRIDVHSGQDLSLLFSITGENSGDAFGVCFDGGDLNGDGYSDLVVNAYWYGEGPLLEAGRVYIFYGGPGPWASERFAADADTTIDGEQVGDHLGSERGLIVIDDVDGDSCAELVLGADSWDFGIHPGRVYVYSGQTLDTIYTLEGENLLDNFGSSIRPGGDINGDGIQDLLVGAHRDWTGVGGLGHVYVYSAADGQLLWHLMSGEAADAFGWGLDGIGDVNNDGYDDLAVGAHHWPFDGERHDTGRAYVFLGGPGPFPDTTFIDAAVYQFQGEFDFSHFGGTIRGLGDINQDGHDDFAITAYTFWPTVSRRGVGWANVYSGLDGTEMFRMTDGVLVGRFGYGLASALDLDQDGIRELWVGAPTYDEIGQVYCYLIGDTDQDTVMAGCDNCPMDFNADQADDDVDGYGDVCDNCPAVGNPDQGITIAMNGDVNTDGTITSADIIYLVNYVFKGGASPLPCEASGDVNCSGKVTSADVIYLVNYVFKGGEPPCDICQAFGLGWSCP